MRFTELNESNYLLFAIKFYDNPQSVTREDFESDLKRIRYVKRLLKRYQNNGELKVHLILNHLIILFNVFNEATVPLLFYNLDEELWPAIKSFLIFLNRVSEYPKTKVNEIEADEYCLQQLKEL
ncbi:MAG: hypothetical protein CM15mV14_0120 [uncultured marine virus]|jgi:hypothetical protein|nr:MAG: hypothetical protein CM15mV14_0120 [uncultured marine virus]BDD43873.1 hypothetical protein 35 [bacterium]|tara:strand:- start:74 stop:445 length:372 start_codon:yes stop_codon:yes gene_type:complete